LTAPFNLIGGAFDMFAIHNQLLQSHRSLDPE
jgi:hypothetical protein